MVLLCPVPLVPEPACHRIRQPSGLFAVPFDLHHGHGHNGGDTIYGLYNFLPMAALHQDSQTLAPFLSSSQPDQIHSTFDPLWIFP